MKVICSECGSEQLSWSFSKRNASSGPDGQLRLHDVEPIIVLGCDECSATAHVIADDDELNLLVDSPFDSPSVEIVIRPRRVVACEGCPGVSLS